MSVRRPRTDEPNPLKLLLIVLLAELGACCLNSALMNWLAAWLQPQFAWAHTVAVFAIVSLTGVCAVSNAFSAMGCLAAAESSTDERLAAFARRAMPLICLQTIVLAGACFFAPPILNAALAAASAPAAAIVAFRLPGRAALPDELRK